MEELGGVVVVSSVVVTSGRSNFLVGWCSPPHDAAPGRLRQRSSTQSRSTLNPWHRLLTKAVRDRRHLSPVLITGRVSPTVTSSYCKKRYFILMSVRIPALLMAADRSCSGTIRGSRWRSSPSHRCRGSPWSGPTIGPRPQGQPVLILRPPRFSHSCRPAARPDRRSQHQGEPPTTIRPRRRGRSRRRRHRPRPRTTHRRRERHDTVTTSAHPSRVSHPHWPGVPPSTLPSRVWSWPWERRRSRHSPGRMRPLSAVMLGAGRRRPAPAVRPG